jgi:hypothetical protein
MKRAGGAGEAGGEFWKLLNHPATGATRNILLFAPVPNFFKLINHQ